MSFKDLSNKKVLLTVQESKITAHKLFLENLFNRNSIREPKTRLYGSEAAFCHRQNVFSSEFSRDYTENIIQTFRQQFGHSAEMTWITALKDSENLVTNGLKICDIEDNVSVDKHELFIKSNIPLNYSAKIDFIYTYNGSYILADSKCSSSIPTKLPLNYVRQLQFYSAITGFDAYLIYTTHQKGVFENFEWELFEIDTSEKELISALEVAYLSTFCIQDKLILPKQEEMFKTTTCKYCSFAEYCYAKDEIDFYPFSEPDLPIEMEIRQRATHAAYDFYTDRNKRKQLILEYVESKNVS